jgi:hypothetical protein
MNKFKIGVATFFVACYILMFVLVFWAESNKKPLLNKDPLNEKH